MKQPLPRVLFVDDDAAIRRLVAGALEDLPIALQCCASVAEARAALRERPAQLVITDLMLPVETGFDLLEWLATEPACRAGARLAVFSAGLNAVTCARLAALDVWRELAKPVSLQALENCVRDALGASMPIASPTLPPSDSPLPAQAGRAVALHFGGDVGLYTAFRDQVRAQLEADLAEGGHSLARNDWPGLHRLAHSLKGVLSLLGDDTGAAQARDLEAAAAAAQAPACAQGWPALVRHLETEFLAGD